MPYIHPIIIQNFNTLLRAGAFSITDTKIEPMSTFKWNRLEEIAVRLGISGYISTGIKALADDPNVPKGILENDIEETFSAEGAMMFNRFKAKRFEQIIEQEPHDASSSMETLHLLKLIVAISDDIIVSSLNLAGIITLGRYLRTDGDKVDFVKLEQWLRRLGIKQLAALQAGILIEVFSFEADEFPFLRKRYANARKHYYHLIDSSLNGSTDFSTASRLNVALIETASRHLGNFTTRITDIEE